MKKIISQIKRIFHIADTKIIEKALIASYAQQHSIELQDTIEIKKFLLHEEYDEIAMYISLNHPLNGLDDLVTAFEVLVDGTKKKSKGVVYTPWEIRDYISAEIITMREIPKVIDPACGCGAFLISAAKTIHSRYTISYSEIFSRYIWGCDIDSHSLDKCKVLFEILSLSAGEKAIGINYNLIAGNSLEVFASQKYKGKFDVVLGNPPYVRSKNIDLETKSSLTNWCKVVSGNVDLYIPFFQIGIELLNDHGKLGYITPNTFLQSVNGRALRNYIRDQKIYLKIINFKDTQQFESVTHYTCISFIYKEIKDGAIDYSIYKDAFSNCKFTKYSISGYDDDAEWRFVDAHIDKLIYKIEQQTDKLDNYHIRNGLATLCNELYFFSVIKEDKDYYYRIYEGQEYRIEKGICIDVAKPNILRSEEDLLAKSEKAIFPYHQDKIISEDNMMNRFPLTYQFLFKYKTVLEKRDKGNMNNYPTWYAYGRSQGMHNTGKKLLIPYMAERGIAILSEDEDLLFYCGYAIFSEDVKTLRILKLFIESDIFYFYIKMTSKPYSKGFFALSKNYIKNFGIPELSCEQKEKLLILESKERERYIANLYNIDYSTICKHIKSTT